MLPVTCLADFLEAQSMRALLLKGSVLLHDKRAYAEMTLDMLREAQKRRARFLRLPAEGTTTDVLTITRATTPPTVFIARRRDISADVVKLLEHHARPDRRVSPNGVARPGTDMGTLQGGADSRGGDLTARVRRSVSR